MTLRRTREFTAPTDARSAGELVRQLGEFEDNVARETVDLRQAFLPVLKLQNPAAAESGTTLAPGQSLGVDTADDDVEILLVAPEAKYQGKFAAVFKRVAANTLTLRPSGGALINESATAAITAVGLTLIFCDGSAYWYGA
jgi:hypothetical protein